MGRMIDADAIPWMIGVSGDVVVYPDTIARMPTVEPKRGRWIKPTGMMPSEHHGHYECSECGAWALRDWAKPWTHRETNGTVLTNYCPNCGLPMREGEE